MKVLFIQPPTNPHVWGGDAIFVLEPLWAEYLAAGLKDVHESLLFDMRLEKASVDERIADVNPDIVAMTAYTVDVNTVKKIAGQIKRINPGIRVVVGGYFANGAYPELNEPDIDVVVPGEGVLTFRELVDAWDLHGDSADLEAISGLALRHGETMELTPVRPWPNLDDYRFPDRSISAHVRGDYFYSWMKPIATISSSYSCPFRCEFCCLWPTTDGKYLARSAKSVVDEIESIEEECVWFTDDEALIDGRRMAEIARLIEERGIRKQYFFMTRADSIRRHPDVIAQWASIGLRRVMVGFESIRSSDLIDFNKEATTDDTDEAIRILQANDIEINSNFVLTQDYEPVDFANLQAYVDSLDLGLPLYFILTPFPGTVTHQKRKDEIFIHDYDYYDLLHTVLPTKMPIRDFYYEYSKLYGALEPLRRGIAGHGENLDEVVLRNLQKIRRTMDKSPEGSPPTGGVN